MTSSTELVRRCQDMLIQAGNELSVDEWLKVESAFTLAKTAVQARNRLGSQFSSDEAKKKRRTQGISAWREIHRNVDNSKVFEPGGELTVGIMLEDEDTIRTLRVKETDTMDKLFGAVGIPTEHKGVELLMGGSSLELQATFRDNEVCEGSRITVRWPQAWSFFQVVDDLIDANPKLRQDKKVIVERASLQKESDGSVEGWDLRYLDISRLPPSFGHLFIDGTLDLSGNDLSRLPESFRYLRVDGDLNLLIRITLGLGQDRSAAPRTPKHRPQAFYGYSQRT